MTAARAASERSGLRATEDDLAGDMVELQAVRERSEARDRDAGVVACPFKGLASFEVEDADMFFGRERLVARMVARLAGAPLMAVVGPSGSGKSSALGAGLLAALRAGVLPGSGGWPLVLLRPGEHPLRALEQATVGISSESRMILAVDQFEEVFTACRDEHERGAFVDALVAFSRDPRRRALVLVAIRADFYGRCAAYPELSTLLDANHVLVGPMRRDELRRAIELPAQRAGLHVEPDLVDALIAEVEDEPGALPLLSTTLLELWEQRDGRRMRMRAYEQAGGVRGAVARLAERAYERLDPDRQGVARRILLRLAVGGEEDAVVRRRVPLEELQGEAVAEVLDVLADERLVTIDEGAVEVAHEALLREWPRLRGWLEEDVQGRRLHHQLRNAAREWDAGGRDPGELYRGARLASTLEWAADHDTELNAGERGFLAESRAASERSERRVRGVLAGVAALLVLAVIAGVVALDQRGSARDEATAADAQRLGSRALVEEDFDRALLLAQQGVALDDTVRTRGNLLAALLKGPAAIGVMRVAGDPITAELSPDDRTLAVGTNSGEVRFFDTRARRRSATLRTTPARAAVRALAYSPDGRRLAVAHMDIPGETLFYAPTFGFVVVVLDVRTRRTLLRITLPRERPLSGMRFSPNGRAIDVTLFTPQFPRPEAATFTRFDARTGRRVLGPVRVDHGGRFSPALQLRPDSPVLITGDGRRMVVAEERGITVRDAATGAIRDRFGTGASHSFPNAYALSRDDRTLAIGGEDGSVRFLDLRSGRSRPASGRHAAAVTGARFTADGRWLVTTGDDATTIPMGRPQGGGRRDAVGPGRQRLLAAADAQRADPLHGVPERHGLRVGPPRLTTARPALQDRRCRGAKKRRQRRRPADRDGTVRRRDQHRRRAHAQTRASRSQWSATARSRGSPSSPAATSWSWAATAASSPWSTPTVGASCGACPGTADSSSPLASAPTGACSPPPAPTTAACSCGPCRTGAGWALRCASPARSTTRSSVRTAAGSRSVSSPRPTCPRRSRSGTFGAAVASSVRDLPAASLMRSSARTAGCWSC